MASFPLINILDILFVHLNTAIRANKGAPGAACAFTPGFKFHRLYPARVKLFLRNDQALRANANA
jgi:hypothetical protein